MCGIVGLHLREPSLYPRLGVLLPGMLGQVAERPVIGRHTSSAASVESLAFQVGIVAMFGAAAYGLVTWFQGVWPSIVGPEGPKLMTPAFAVAGTAIGAALAAIVFGLSAVSLPMLVDRPVDSVTAAVTSMRACLANPVTMALWAAVIVTITVLGALPGYLGFVLALPLLGHATWYAYKDLVEPTEQTP